VRLGENCAQTQVKPVGSVHIRQQLAKPGNNCPNPGITGFTLLINPLGYSPSGQHLSDININDRMAGGGEKTLRRGL